MSAGQIRHGLMPRYQVAMDSPLSMIKMKAGVAINIRKNVEDNRTVRPDVLHWHEVGMPKGDAKFFLDLGE